MKDSGLHQIGEVAERVGLSLRTVRYYEEAGLVFPAERTDGGFRLYRDEDIARLELIKEMKPLGFTIQEMRDLLEARDALEAPGDGALPRDEALDTLAGFASRAKEQTEKLRRQLETAERFSQNLGRQLRRHRRRRAPAGQNP